ncbi:hypothetical protein SAY87_006851 [Trapa incisa]|uniref:Uncharacterized protein n=1 Tax=Trapa incisa TaxID=236973 RepID=A0AAN7Q062_9MYRT|nr:hypothetical protein SAY87_006851 [Trapa incisa]
MPEREVKETEAMSLSPINVKSHPPATAAAMGGSAIHIREAVVVTPSEPTPATVLPLSALDTQPFLRFTIEYLLIYELAHYQDRCFTVARIKSALAQALVPYYPLAGRVRHSPHGGGGLEVVCRAQGAVFIEAVSEQVAAGFRKAPRHVSQWRRFLSLHVPDVLQGAPPLVVQLTWLRDGNAAIGVGINHCLCDGIGSGEFLQTFSDLARRGLVGGGGGDELQWRPVWDRHLVDSVGSPHETSLDDHDLGTAPVADLGRDTDVCGLTSRFSRERLVPTAVVFNGGFLDELKEAASSTCQSSRRSTSTYTSFEVLSAHVWRTWARSLNLPSKQTLKLMFSVNIRNRVKPGIPSGYYGNAFVLGCAESSVRDLTEKGLGHVAELVKQAKARVNASYVRVIIDSVRGGTRGGVMTNALIMSQWSTLGLDKVDFGMGKPVEVSPVCCDRYCLILPRGGGGDRRDGVKVMVAVPASAVEKYERLVMCSHS